MKVIAELNLTDLTAAEFAAYEARCAALGIQASAHLAELIRADLGAADPSPTATQPKRGRKAA
mgnify:CR=1 FL=1